MQLDSLSFRGAMKKKRRKRRAMNRNLHTCTFLVVLNQLSESALVFTCLYSESHVLKNALCICYRKIKCGQNDALNFLKCETSNMSHVHLKQKQQDCWLDKGTPSCLHVLYNRAIVRLDPVSFLSGFTLHHRFFNLVCG